MEPISGVAWASSRKSEELGQEAEATRKNLGEDAQATGALESLAILFDYPPADVWQRTEACVERLGAVDTKAAAHLREFGARIAGVTLHELEELYIQTFDLNPVCTLDLGWQLFGEDYNRGLFLVKVRREMKRLGLEETHELPDHITHVLNLLSRMEPEEAEDFAMACVLPAIRKTCAGLSESGIYRPLVEGVLQFLSGRYEQTLQELNHGVPI